MASYGEIVKHRAGTQTNTIDEYTAASGVRVDGVLLKDAGVTASGGVSTNTITEFTSGSGVTIDGVLLKDSGITATGTNTINLTTISADTINETTSGSGVTVDSVLLKDGNVSTLASGTVTTTYLQAKDTQTFALKNSTGTSTLTVTEAGAVTLGSSVASSTLGHIVYMKAGTIASGTAGFRCITNNDVSGTDGEIRFGHNTTTRESYIGSAKSDGTGAGLRFGTYQTEVGGYNSSGAWKLAPDGAAFNDIVTVNGPGSGAAGQNFFNFNRNYGGSIGHLHGTVGLSLAGNAYQTTYNTDSWTQRTTAAGSTMISVEDKIIFYTAASGKSPAALATFWTKTGECSSAGAWTLGASTTTGQHILQNGDDSAGTLVIWNSGSSSTARPGIDVKKAPNDSTTSQIFMRFLINTSTVSGGTLNGGIRANGANVAEFYNTSDARLKNITGEYTGGLSIVMGVPVDRYSWKSDPDNKVTYGWVAQKLQAYLPEAVGADEDGILSVGTSDIPKVLWSAIREQQALIEALQVEVAALKAR